MNESNFYAFMKNMDEKYHIYVDYGYVRRFSEVKIIIYPSNWNDYDEEFLPGKVYQVNADINDVIVLFKNLYGY